MTTSDAAPMNDDGIAYQSPQSSAGPNQQPSSQPIKRHDEYYISDSGSMSIFLVEDTHYKVHRYFLTRESSVFKTMFDCPHPVEGQDGESDEKPIRLPGVSCAEFEALIDFFYNGMFTPESKKNKSKNRIFPTSTYNLLNIAFRYEFDRVIKKVVADIDDSADDTDPVMKICLGIAHDSLRYWVQPAYNALIGRDHSLIKDEIIWLGAGRTAIVVAAREKNIRDPRARGFPSSVRPVYAAPVDESSKSKWAFEIPPEFYSV